MILRWTEAAADDLERIAKYLLRNAPGHAERIVQAIYDSPEQLRQFPERGRPGRVSRTCELVLA